jgi:hypothetical protein
MVILALALAAPTAASARARTAGTPVPRGFVGVTLDAPPLTPQDNVALAQQLDVMRSSGVQSVRVSFSWSGAQPYARWSDVPPERQGGFVSGAGNVPTDFSATDQIVGLAAARGLRVLPTVIYAPGWDAITSRTGLARPRDDGPYGEFLTTLIGRYGPNGSFWTDNPGIPTRPIREWQVWNEPEISFFWPTSPWAPSYVALLRVADAAIKTADPGAKVVLGGLTDYSWLELGVIYALPDTKSLFDIVDVHPYTGTPVGVVKIISYVRAEIQRVHDANKPIIVGETSFTSSLGQTRHRYTWEATPRGQAKKVSSLLPLLAAARRSLRIVGFYWYTWMGDESIANSPWNFCGLLAYRNGQIINKPALTAFRRTAAALER